MIKFAADGCHSCICPHSYCNKTLNFDFDTEYKDHLYVIKEKICCPCCDEEFHISTVLRLEVQTEKL